METLNKWVITLTSEIPGYSIKVKDLYNSARNQFCNILLDNHLYNLKDYETIVSFY